jgi:hypothetical protein
MVIRLLVIVGLMASAVLVPSESTAGCQTQPPGETVDCTLKRVRAYTDATGRVTFAITGAANNTGAVGTFAAPGCGLDGVRILADGENVQSVTAAVLDQNGAVGDNGVNAADLAYVADDFGSAALNGTYRGRSDYNNFDAANYGLDLSVYGDCLGAAALGDGSASGYPGTAYCP